MTTRITLALCILLALVGWLGLGFFTYLYPPDALNRLLALAILWPTLVATFLPVAYRINLDRARAGDLVPRAARQSALAASLLTLCVWLRMIRALNWANAALMLMLFVMTEALLSSKQA